MNVLVFILKTKYYLHLYLINFVVNYINSLLNIYKNVNVQCIKYIQFTDNLVFFRSGNKNLIVGGGVYIFFSPIILGLFSCFFLIIYYPRRSWFFCFEALLFHFKFSKSAAKTTTKPHQTDICVLRAIFYVVPAAPSHLLGDSLCKSILGNLAILGNAL